jgi:hypothetical protein
MKRATAIIFAVTLFVGIAVEAAADDPDDAYQRSGSEREQHADAIFTGVFGQCRQQVGSEASGLVAVVFSIGKSGKFGATATHKVSEGESVIRDLARCMGERANQARHFPESGSKTIVGVKYRVSGDGELLMLGAGEARTLRDGDVFRWAREDPSGGNS